MIMNLLPPIPRFNALWTISCPTYEDFPKSGFDKINDLGGIRLPGDYDFIILMLSMLIQANDISTETVSGMANAVHGAICGNPNDMVQSITPIIADIIATYPINLVSGVWINFTPYKSPPNSKNAKKMTDTTKCIMPADSLKMPISMRNIAPVAINEQPRIPNLDDC